MMLSLSTGSLAFYHICHSDDSRTLFCARFELFVIIAADGCLQRMINAYEDIHSIGITLHVEFSITWKLP